MKTYILFLSCVFACMISFSQTAKHRVLSIPVQRYNAPLFEPWEGGMNSPQFSEINLNNDSFPDLFVFDKEGDKVMTFINRGNSTDSTYVYAPQYEELFPKDLYSWALIRDYNNDNIPDIFTHDILGTRVYKGSYVNGQLHFDIVSPLLEFDGGQSLINIWTNLDDMPAFVDVNRDGDIDVLTYSIAGAVIEYYENQTVEHAGDPHYDIDSFKYEYETGCWGNVMQNSLTNSMILNAVCKGNNETNPNVGEAQGQRHAGNTIFTFDDCNDHDVDVLNGNIGYDNLAFLNNCGDSSYANICSWDSAFPSCNISIDMPSYPAAYNVDVDNDGLWDLVIAPNQRDLGARDVHNVMVYKNHNTCICGFTYENDSFLVQHILDFGTDAKPVFFDMNGDGLKDIIVGNYGYFRQFQTYKSALAYLENIGTATHPVYTLQTADYDSMSNFGLIAVHPAFGDLNGDGKEDLVLGDSNGYLWFFKNAGTTVASFPSMTTPQYFGIDVGEFSAPFIYDINGDSLNDFVVGNKLGKLTYFWNYGTRTSPLFSMDSSNANFGGINVTQVGYSEGDSQPFITKDSSGNMTLFVGSLDGRVFEYAIDTTKLRGGAFTQIDSDFIKHDIGSKSCFAIADLNNDGKMEYAIGTSRGGILLYSDSVWDPDTELGIPSITANENLLLIYPNPAKDYFVCALQNGDFRNPKTEVYNLLGEKMIAETKQNATSVTINTSQLSDGFYMVRIFDQEKTYIGKILVTK